MRPTADFVNYGAHRTSIEADCAFQQLAVSNTAALVVLEQAILHFEATFSPATVSSATACLVR